MTEVGPLVMQLYDKTIYTYPIGAKAVGWCLALSSIMMVPLVAVKTLLQLPGSFSQVKTDKSIHRGKGMVPLLQLSINCRIGCSMWKMFCMLQK